ncbi:MAG: hypothetical protein JSV09_06595 [Thermoplasmata archaeon]|nr:MAG: hypothetical protein JSV09_06595 [Thermoplasmata archaeon]
MMQIARLRIISDDEKEINAKKEAVETTWNHIIENYRAWETEDVIPLYLTHRGIYNDISLIVHSKSADSFADYILKNLKNLDSVKDVWIFDLIKPELFSPPKNISQNLKRFTMALKTHPKEMKSIYLKISKVKPPSNIIITYITFTFHKHNDILISLLAEDRLSVEEFARDYIEGLRGVVSTEVVPIIKSKNLATADEWKKRCGQYFKLRDGTEKELEIYERWYKRGFE